MIFKMYIVIEGFVIAWTMFLGMLSDTAILGLFALIGTLITTTGTVVSILINKRVATNVKDMAVKQEVVHKQIDGKMTELLDAATGKAKAEGKLETKDELIEVLKQAEPLVKKDEKPQEDEKPIDVVVIKNLDKPL